jgi:hypothetical protein
MSVMISSQSFLANAGTVQVKQAANTFLISLTIHESHRIPSYKLCS